MQLPVISLLIIVAIVIGSPAHAKPSMQVKTAVERVENLNPRGQNLVLPYGFNAESTGPVLGLGGMRKGFLQDQMTVGGAAFAGEDSHGFFAGVWDYRACVINAFLRFSCCVP